MNKKIIVSIIGVSLLATTGCSIANNKSDTQPIPVAPQTPVPSQTPASTEIKKEQPVKEFTMQSFVEIVDGQPKPQYSLKEITVNKGDLVRIKITVTKGMHDFKIDEYNVYADTQPNVETIVEFTADKTGEFVYYCTKPGHRQNGHWGTLKVLE